jgi:hypothetical protein
MMRKAGGGCRAWSRSGRSRMLGPSPRHPSNANEFTAMTGSKRLGAMLALFIHEVVCIELMGGDEAVGLA